MSKIIRFEHSEEMSRTSRRIGTPSRGDDIVVFKNEKRHHGVRRHVCCRSTVGAARQG